jgi:hypothetical protein
MAQEILIQKGLPMWAKGVIAVAAVGLVGFITYEVYKAIKNAVDKKDNKQTVNDASNELTDLLKSGMKLSNPLSTYDSTANSIQVALNGCETSNTEYSVVRNILKVVNNRADWLQLIKSFGVRDVENCGYFTGKTKYDLPTLLKDQLDSHALLFSEKIGSKTYNGWLLSLDVLTDELQKLGINL